MEPGLAAIGRPALRGRPPSCWPSSASGGSTARYEHQQKTPTRMREGSMFGGARRDRTADLNTASVALSQLSYGPKSKTANITSQRGWCQGRIRFAKVWFANLGGEKCLVNYC